MKAVTRHPLCNYGHLDGKCWQLARGRHTSFSRFLRNRRNTIGLWRNTSQTPSVLFRSLVSFALVGLLRRFIKDNETNGFLRQFLRWMIWTIIIHASDEDNAIVYILFATQFQSFLILYILFWDEIYQVRFWRFVRAWCTIIRWRMFMQNKDIK